AAESVGHADLAGRQAEARLPAALDAGAPRLRGGGHPRCSEARAGGGRGAGARRDDARLRLAGAARGSVGKRFLPAAVHRPRLRRDRRQKPSASVRVSSPAGISRQPVAFCPLHNGEKSPLPRASALARSGVIAEVASGNAGASALIGPSSRITLLTMPRAGRPVKRLVSVVLRAASLFNAARCTALVVASGQSR